MNLLFEIYNKLILNEDVSVNSVTDSIKNKYQVVLNYEGDPKHGVAPGIRTIEVYVYGLTKAGNPVIRAYQPYGDTASEVPNWKFFRLDRIKSWKPTYKLINKPAPKFNPNGDGSMSIVYSIANFDEEPGTPTTITGPRQKYKQVGKLDNIEKIIADREKEKSRKKATPTMEPKVTSKNTNIEEPKVQDTEKNVVQSIPEPQISNTIPKSDEDDFTIQDKKAKTRGDEELEKMKDLNRRLDNARKIDLNKFNKK